MSAPVIEDVWAAPVQGGRFFQHGEGCTGGSACPDYECGGRWVEAHYHYQCSGDGRHADRPCVCAAPPPVPCPCLVTP